MGYFCEFAGDLDVLDLYTPAYIVGKRRLIAALVAKWSPLTCLAEVAVAVRKALRRPRPQHREWQAAMLHARRRTR